MPCEKRACIQGKPVCFSRLWALQGTPFSESTSPIFLPSSKGKSQQTAVAFFRKLTFGDYNAMEDQGQNVYLLSRKQLAVCICIVPSKLYRGTRSTLALHAMWHLSEWQFAPNCLQPEPGKWKDREGERFAENHTADQ